MMATNNYTRRNFEKNDNVTMFVGSMDLKGTRQYSKEQEKYMAEEQRLKQKAEFEDFRRCDIERIRKQAQKEQQRQINKKELSMKKKLKSRESEQSMQPVEPESLLHPLGMSAMQRQKEAAVGSNRKQKKEQPTDKHLLNSQSLIDMKNFLRYMTPRQ